MNQDPSRVSAIEEHLGVELPSLDAAQGSSTIALCICEDLHRAHREAADALCRGGFVVREASADRFIWQPRLSQECSVIVLDIFLIRGIGLRVCRQLRVLTHLPILAVLRGAARDEVLAAYAAGIDMYVLAPFGEQEFLARTRALLRRWPSQSAARV